MLDLRELIIQRIEEAQGLSARIANYLSESIPPATLDTQFQVNRSILKLLAKYKRRERERSYQEEDLFAQLKQLRLWNAKSIQQFYKISLAILGKYDPAIFSHLETGQPLLERLRILYHVFINQHLGGIAPKKIQASLQRISQTSLLIIFEWVSQWSRDLISQKIQQSMTAQFIRHEEQMKRISHFRSSVLTQKEKQIPSSSGPPLILSNKESVFGLFLEEITSYYRSMPLQLDFTFIKSIRKVYSKGDELKRPQNLQKAAEILIQSKNKFIKQGRQQFKQQYIEFIQRCPSFKVVPDYESISQKISVSQNKGERRYKRKAQFERVKSQSKQQESGNQTQNRGSLLLCPKTNDISFESSKEIMAKLRKQKDKRDLQLPEISQGRIADNNSRSTAVRTKPIRSFFGPVNRSLISNYDRALKHSQQVTPKHYEFKQPISIQKLLKKNNYSSISGSKQEKALQQQALGLKMDGEELKRNQKLMLYLLREKNKHAFLEK